MTFSLRNRWWKLATTVLNKIGLSCIYLKQQTQNEANEVEENKGRMLLKPGEISGRCRQFDMANDCWDHHFLDDSQKKLAEDGLARMEYSREKPYFNEAVYDKQLGRVKVKTNSASYNENAFLVTCQSTLYILRKLPKVNFHIL
ncbi:hypothetical protein F3Y22_tig00110936pilonHSYRG00011 [Hibiscus syriacus]|uniref:Uncharacterized protein n=1 Tax=Hibiscus syriacus TaxID=106335 RepID=A0A6A2ZC35_HIBSY|nr:hypothetical protein F3Y22_tig00110936pilonHSYRG00011 [Hibiscus syriacus]